MNRLIYTLISWLLLTVARADMPILNERDVKLLNSLEVIESKKVLDFNDFRDIRAGLEATEYLLLVQSLRNLISHDLMDVWVEFRDSNSKREMPPIASYVEALISIKMENSGKPLIEILPENIASLILRNRCPEPAFVICGYENVESLLVKIVMIDLIKRGSSKSDMEKRLSGFWLNPAHERMLNHIK